MTYQALARKWRPRSFDQLVGQEHIVAALTHALDSNRVHHGFLFTGTRGVGKTTLARILAKCLNCEQGVSSTPCNECHACRSIDEGRFVDLIEVDAASRTQVADTRELLDNVQYAPTTGRFKVYLIDEVHMLSPHSFNALLKTLEEPPPHVKFLFATTDPQKLPVTILSRCLQFNLKMLQIDQIQDQLKQILESEGIEHEDEALRLLARSADGSMRDGLSLLDQAISQGNGRVEAETVRLMLGLIETDYVQALLEALARGDARGVFAVVDTVSQRSTAYTQILDDLLTQLFHLSLYKRDPALLEAKQEAASWHPSVAELLGEEDLQLYYQIALLGKRDLPLSPDPRTGFEMVMLRLLAFRPAEAGDRPGGGTGRSVAATATAPPGTESVQEQEHAAPPAAPHAAAQAPETDWRRLARQLPLSGFAQELAMNLALQSRENGKWSFELNPLHEHLVNDERRAAVSRAISEKIGEPVEVRISLSQPAAETPVQSVEREKSEKLKQAEQAIRSDPGVQDLIDQFGATLVEDSIRSRK
jgi:DNA polymerase III subunit gamma/tau